MLSTIGSLNLIFIFNLQREAEVKAAEMEKREKELAEQQAKIEEEK